MLFAQALYELDHEGLRQLFSFAESFGYGRHDAGGLKRGELFPMNLVVDDVWHVTLVWKDRDGIVRLYDSDRLPGSQVFVERSPGFERYITAHTAETPLREKFG